MADIEATVGETGPNKAHDVALVQAMLRVTRDAAGKPYLESAYDRPFTDVTTKAIARFQVEQSILAPTSTPPASGRASPLSLTQPMVGQPKPRPSLLGELGAELAGSVKPNGPTLKRLSEALPAEYRGMRALPGAPIVYLEAASTEAEFGYRSVVHASNVDSVFRLTVERAMRQLYARSGLALQLAAKGGRRSFEDQADVIRKRPRSTKVGPGESNHTYGRAVDLTFYKLRWLQSDGSIVTGTQMKTAADLLEEKKGISVSDKLWDLRDQPIVGAGLFVIPMTKRFRDRPHVQSFNHLSVNLGNALAKLLNGLGSAYRWENAGGSPRAYRCNLGLRSSAFVNVGTAMDIWETRAGLGTAEIVSAINGSRIPLPHARAIWTGQPSAPSGTFKPIGITDVTANDLVLARKALRRQFELADQNFNQWQP
jgi:hypothetical protein